MKSLMVKVVLPIILIFLFTYASAQQNQTESRDAEFYFNRGHAYYFQREYEKSWKDVENAQYLGYRIDPEFLDDLCKASGRKN